MTSLLIKKEETEKLIEKHGTLEMLKITIKDDVFMFGHITVYDEAFFFKTK
jgi:hypothetical protein